MLRCSTIALLVCALSMAVSGQAPAPQLAELTIGSQAPGLAAATWLRGDSRAALPRDRVHVVEFWATWCGPCIAAFPHLGDLATKWADKVRVVGINSWDYRGKQRDAVETPAAHRDRITAFLAEQGERVRFDVACDDAKGTIATTWMTAAGRDTIPCTFVVDREGRIAWIGNPRDLDAPLAAIVEGRWDLAAHQAEFEAERMRARAAAEAKAR